jgi:hypothetical protein
MYIVPPTTSGADSCPRSTPVEKEKLGLSCATLLDVISASALKRVFASSLAGVRHSPSSAADAAAICDAGRRS